MLFFTKKTSWPCWLLVWALLTCCGCFEVREEVNLKTDGSGEATWVVNLSQSRGKVRQYLKLGRAEGFRVPQPATVETALLQLRNTLRIQPGISYAQTQADWNRFVFTLTVRFDDLPALNRALTAASQQLAPWGLPPLEEAHFHYQGRQFERLFDYPLEPEAFAALPSVQQRMLQAAEFISIYRFERDIRQHSHPAARRSPSGRAIMLRLQLAALADGSGTLANRVDF